MRTGGGLCGSIGAGRGVGGGDGSLEMGGGCGEGGRSEREKDFRFLPFRPGDNGRTDAPERLPLSVEEEVPGRRVASEFCSVMG